MFPAFTLLLLALVLVVLAAATKVDLIDSTAPVLFGGRIPIAPNSTARITYRQASRAGIVKRAEARKLIARGAIKPRVSAKVYPTCSPNQPGYLPKSGFASFYPYNIGGHNFQSGIKVPVKSAIACAMLCENKSGCTAGVWYNGDTCALKQGTIVGSWMGKIDDSFRTFIKGDCASLESQINDPTIMNTCCNNPPPSTIARCTYSGYQNLGPYCQMSGSKISSANRITSTSVGNGNPNDFDDIAKSCAKLCTQWTEASNGQGMWANQFHKSTANETGCVIAVWTYATAKGANNCDLYGGDIFAMSAIDAQYSSTLYTGTCEQAKANNIPMSSANSGCYSPTSGP